MSRGPLKQIVEEKRELGVGAGRVSPSFLVPFVTGDVVNVLNEELGQWL